MSLQLIQQALVSIWNTNASLGGAVPPVPIRIGRSDEGTPYPRGVYFLVSDVTEIGFDPGFLDPFVFQISVWDIDDENVSILIGAIISAYHRQPIVLSSGYMLGCSKIDSGFMIEDKEDPDGQNVYMGYVRFKFWVQS